MPATTSTSRAPIGIVLRQAAGREQLAACFPVILKLRPFLRDAGDWVDRAMSMAPAGYRVLAAWEGEEVVAMAGYRVLENLIHARFLYVDDLVTAEGKRGLGLGAALLGELASVGTTERCGRLVLDTAAANLAARRFYRREGLLEVVAGFVKKLEATT